MHVLKGARLDKGSASGKFDLELMDVRPLGDVLRWSFRIGVRDGAHDRPLFDETMHAHGHAAVSFFLDGGHVAHGLSPLLGPLTSGHESDLRMSGIYRMAQGV